MINIYRMIPSNYWIVRREYLKKELEQIPLIRKGNKCGHNVYRVYKDDHHHFREVSDRSRIWQETESTFNLRCSIEESLALVNRTLKANYHCSEMTGCKTSNNIGYCDNSFYDRLQDSSCSIEKETEYYYNGRYYRSRIEMVIATMLDELGIEFKYDVAVKFNGKYETIDFVLVFREFNRCVFLEFFGRSDEPDSNHRNLLKVELLTNCGFYLGRDLFIISGNKTYAPGIDIIKIQIASIITQLSALHILSGS